MMVVVMMVVVMVDAGGETVVKRLWFRSTSDTFLEDIDTIDRMIADGESQYDKWRHHDPYIVPWAPGGSKFTRNPTPPTGVIFFSSH
ncbi:putative NADH dehydrogenase [ubiquinone] 1 beta subcomplex subunit 9 [Helianthus annuus]|nr:putative NADH dehydrogenase [ubiquinone] 1 beta subcomplex subunit 9 [Helianthus annuus]